MHKALLAVVSALAALGLLGGCLIIAGNGFTTTNKRAQWSVFVPAPQAYVMAAILFLLSTIAVIWLLQQMKARPWVYGLCATGYAGSAIIVCRLVVALI